MLLQMSRPTSVVSFGPEHVVYFWIPRLASIALILANASAIAGSTASAVSAWLSSFGKSSGMYCLTQ